MELFDKRFVYFMWDDELRGKECFYDDDIEGLQQSVNDNNENFKGVLEPDSSAYPFRPVLSGTACFSWKFAYYDPNYECKVAYNEGKQIQHREKGTHAWSDGTPAWDGRYEYRIKPSVYYVGIDKTKKLARDCVPTSYQHVYASFDNAPDADKWISEHKKFVPVMRAFEKGLTVEYKNSRDDWTIASTPSWDLKLRYRVKPMQSNVTPHCSDCNHLTKSFTSEPCNKCFDASKWEPRKRRMTNRELAKWLAEGNGQVMEDYDKLVRIMYEYTNDDDMPCRIGAFIRAWTETEWHAPEVEEHTQEVF